MTREEAIIRMECCRNFLANNYSDMGDPNAMALDMAIKALEALDKLDVIIVKQLDESTDQKECMTLRWVLDKVSEVI